jgi:hypothetical protein
MGQTHQETVKNYRKRLEDKGIVRLEVQAPKDDVQIIKQIVKILRGNYSQAVNMRTHLNEAIKSVPKSGLKQLLASAPLDDIDLTRDNDLPRKVDL